MSPRPPEGATGVAPETAFSETSDRAIDGPKIMIVTAITDIGYVMNRFDKKPNPPPIRSCLVEGVFADTGEAVKINRDIKLSFNEQSNLIAFVTAVRGGKKPTDEEAVDPSEIVGIPIAITIESKQQREGDDYWLSMKTPTALMDGVTVPDFIAELMPDEVAAPFAWKTDAELGAIRASLGAASPADGGASDDHYGSYDEQDDRPDSDDLPF